MKKNFAFVFPGQGSQFIGMLDELENQFSVVDELLSIASQILKFDLKRIIKEGPVELLSQTQYTQPAMLVADVAIWRIWQGKNGFQPAILAGHSLGEYAAYVAAGAILFSDAVTLVGQRAQCMQDAVADIESAMAVILGLSSNDVVEVCEKAQTDGYVEAVNFNSPVQIVIGGHKRAVEKAMELAIQNGAKRAQILPMSVPSHCKLMESAAIKFARFLEDTPIKSPTIPVISNAYINIPKDPDEIRQSLQSQLYKPVQWIKIIDTMVELGIDSIVECGPAKVLTGLNKRINPKLQLFNLMPLKNIEKILPESQDV